MFGLPAGARATLHLRSASSQAPPVLLLTRFPRTKVQILTLLAASQSALYLRGGAGSDEAEEANAQVLDANGSAFLIVP